MACHAGMHGAGLYAAVAMPRPAILELTTQRIPNRNAPNLMRHLGGQGCGEKARQAGRFEDEEGGGVWGECRWSGARWQYWHQLRLVLR